MQQVWKALLPSQPYSWLPPYTHGKEDPQSSNLESEEPPQEEALPQDEALHLPQVKTTNLKHNFSIKYDFFESNKYLPCSITKEQQQGEGREEREDPLL